MKRVTDRPGFSGTVEEWLPLVWWVYRHLPEHVYRRLPKDDLFQAGVEGLLNAKRLFDPARGVSWKTFAAHKVRWAMLIAAGLTRKGWAPLELRLREGDS